MIEAAQQVLEAHGEPLKVDELWRRIAEQGLFHSEGKTPAATLSAELLRASVGANVSKGRGERPFYRAGPATFGLAKWLGVGDTYESVVQDVLHESTEPSEPEVAVAVELESIEPAIPALVRQPRYSREDLLRETGFQEEEVERLVRVLERKQQLILQGPPGTGKTFLANRLARLLVSETLGTMQLVQFHPAYSYEDFIQGIRPQVVDGTLSYNLMDGRFLEFCRQARDLRRKGAPCVLIIDEINRANLSRVFGELMYLLEYRDQEVPLASGGTPLRIPPNAYVIGTMNTADRSIARMDHALRRRFSFIRLRPDYDILRKRLVAGGHAPEPLLETLVAVNRLINDPNYELGISYFMKDELPLHLPDIWECEIEPYLDEFFYDEPEKVEPFRWKTLAKGALKGWS